MPLNKNQPHFIFFPSVTKILGVHDIQFSTIAGGEHLLNVPETDVCLSGSLLYPFARKVPVVSRVMRSENIIVGMADSNTANVTEILGEQAPTHVTFAVM